MSKKVKITILSIFSLLTIVIFVGCGSDNKSTGVTSIYSEESAGSYKMPIWKTFKASKDEGGENISYNLYLEPATKKFEHWRSRVDQATGDSHTYYVSGTYKIQDVQGRKWLRLVGSSIKPNGCNCPNKFLTTGEHGAPFLEWEGIDKNIKSANSGLMNFLIRDGYTKDGTVNAPYSESYNLGTATVRFVCF